MQLDEAMNRNRRWGNKPCEHTFREKEYYLGAHTGDYVCTQCGETGWGRDWPARERAEREEQQKERQE